MWSLFKCLEMKVFKVPTLQEVADQKMINAVNELKSAEDALKVAQYRRHIASMEINALRAWDTINKGVPLLGDINDKQPMQQSEMQAWGGPNNGT